MAELTDDNEKSEKNEAIEKKLRDKEEAKTTNVVASPVTEGKTSALPEDLKAKIDAAEKVDAARPASEKAQDKVDDLAEKLEKLNKEADEVKADATKKDEAKAKNDEVLKQTTEAVEAAKANGADNDTIIKPLEDAKAKLEAKKAELDKAAEEAAEAKKEYEDAIAALEADKKQAEAEVKAAKEEEAKNPPKKEEPTPEAPKEKTEADKAAEAKAEADAKVAELEKKVAEEAKKVEEATTKATKEDEDVKAAQTKKDEADKAKADAEAELAKAKEEADKAKTKVEELKKDEADTRIKLKEALEQLEENAIAEINKDASITDKDKAIADKKAEIGKEAILDAVEKGDLTANDILKELENDYNTRNKAPEKVKETKKLDAEEQKKVDEAAKKEASKPIVKKLTDIADDLAEKIEKLTKVADKDKADATEKAKAVEEKNAALKKQNDTLEKAKAALETAKKNEADQAIQAGLQDAVNKLEAAVASAKTAADEAQAKFDEVNEVVKAYKSAIDELTDDYNATLGYIENLKEVPKGEEPKDFSGGVNPSDAPSAEEKPEFTGGVNAVEAAVNEVPEFTGAVNDGEAPIVPNNPDGEAPKPDAPVEKNTSIKDEIKRLRDEIAKLESDLKDAENNGAEDYFKEGLQKSLDNAKNELNELLAAWLNNVTEVPEFKGGVNAVAPAVNEVPEFGANNPEIKKILDEIAKVKEQIKDGEENGAEPYYIEGLTNRLNDLEEALNTLLENKPAIHEVPAFDLAKLGTTTPGVDFGQKAPEVKEPAKVEAKNEKSLPNTGMNTSSTTALGLSLIGLIGLAVRRKLSK